MANVHIQTCLLKETEVAFKFKNQWSLLQVVSLRNFIHIFLFYFHA
jgi:hypothetical protein